MPDPASDALIMYAGEVRAPISAIASLPMNERKVIAHRAMLMIHRPHAIVNLGIGMPEVHCQTMYAPPTWHLQDLH